MANWWDKGRQEKSQLGRTVFSSVRSAKKKDNRSLFHYQALEPAFSDRFRPDGEDADHTYDAPVQNVSHLRNPVIARQYREDSPRRSSWSSSDSRKVPDDPICRHSVAVAPHGTEVSFQRTTDASSTVVPSDSTDTGPNLPHQPNLDQHSQLIQHQSEAADVQPKRVSEQSNRSSTPEAELDGLKDERERLEAELREAEEAIKKLRSHEQTGLRRRASETRASTNKAVTFRNYDASNRTDSGSEWRPISEVAVGSQSWRFTPERQAVHYADSRNQSDSPRSTDDNELTSAERQAIAEISRAVEERPEDCEEGKEENNGSSRPVIMITTPEHHSISENRVQLNVKLRHSKVAPVAARRQRLSSPEQSGDLRNYQASDDERNQESIVTPCRFNQESEVSAKATLKTPDDEYQERREKAIADLNRLQSKITPDRFIDMMPQFDKQTGASLSDAVREQLAIEEAARVSKDAENAVYVALERDKEAVVQMIV